MCSLKLTHFSNTCRHCNTKHYNRTECYGNRCVGRCVELLRTNQGWQFATGVALQGAQRLWLGQTSLPLPCSEEPAEFVFLGTTTSISLFYSLILIQSGKTWIVLVFIFLVCVCSPPLLCIQNSALSNSFDARRRFRWRNFLPSSSRHRLQSERKSGIYWQTSTINMPEKCTTLNMGK
jgi:hypothetical protein